MPEPTVSKTPGIPAPGAMATSAAAEARTRRLVTVVFIMGLVIILLIGVAAGAGFYIISSLKNIQVTVERRPHAKMQVGPQYKLGDFLVNLSEPDKYVKTTMVLELDVDDFKYLQKIDERSDVIKDIVNNVLSSKHINDVLTVEGKDLLKRELIERINAILPRGRVRYIYFTTFAVQ